MRTLILAGCVLALTVTHAGAQCLGDFNGDGEVSVSELITAVKNSLSHCQVGNGPRFVDNGDGTVSDAQTGLMWEMKDHLDGVENYANPHDADNKYTWSRARSTSPDGTAYTDFLAKLNNGISTDGVAITGCFAGHCDWRLPTSQELPGILLEPYPCGTDPCIAGVFGPTTSGTYYTSTSYTPDAYAWFFLFRTGGSGGVLKTLPIFVRAVRSGS